MCWCPGLKSSFCRRRKSSSKAIDEFLCSLSAFHVDFSACLFGRRVLLINIPCLFLCTLQAICIQTYQHYRTPLGWGQGGWLFLYVCHLCSFCLLFWVAVSYYDPFPKPFLIGGRLLPSGALCVAHGLLTFLVTASDLVLLKLCF